MWVGGGQGRTPKIAKLFKENVTIDELLPYLEAIMRVYNRHGRRDNKYKARIKILLAETGLEKLQQEVDNELARIDRSRFAPVAEELDRVRSRFLMPDYASTDNNTDNNDTSSSVDSANEPEYQRWLQQNVKAHRVAGHAIVMVSLKRIGDIPGDATSDEMRTLARIAEQYSHDELRVTHRQNLVLPHVRESQLPALWNALNEASLASSNIDLPSDIIACPGLCLLYTSPSPRD